MEHAVVSREAWLEARRALVAKERAHMQQGDLLNKERRALPWVKVEKDYEFDSPSGKRTLSDLFDGRSQLFVKHYMLGPGQDHHCVGCALEVDHLEGILVHLQHHDLSYVAIIFLTYAAFGRGCEIFLGIYPFLDVSPKGRAEHGPYHSLGDWARPHDKYGEHGMVEPVGRYHDEGCACSLHRR